MAIFIGHPVLIQVCDVADVGTENKLHQQDMEAIHPPAEQDTV